MSTINDQQLNTSNGQTAEQSFVGKQEPSDIGSVSDDQMLDEERETEPVKDHAKDTAELLPAQAPHTNTKDRTLREFLGMMDQYAPIIPDAVTDYYLNLAGFDCEDARVKRLLALATQKFIADIAQDAYQYSKIRAAGNNAPGTSVPMQPRGRYAKDRGRAVLTMDDLGSAVHEYGISLKRQDFMR